MRNTALRGGMLPFFILVFFTLSILPVCAQSEQSAYEAKTVSGRLNLEDHVEDLSFLSELHQLDLTGKGTTIAVISTGINSDHEQFGGRVIRERCFDNSTKCVKTAACDACTQDDEACLDECRDCSLQYSVCEGQDSSNPAKAQMMDLFNRGSHLTGIAAGEDGVAPGANIVAVNIQSEFFVEKNSDKNRAFMEEEDLEMALKWVLGLKNELGGEKISVVDIDFSSGSYETSCDSEYPEFFRLFQRINEAGMIPVAPAGDHFADGEISFPACLSNVMAVGALAGMDEALIFSFSDHSELVDIVAPGTDIRSASLVNMDETGNVTCTENCYGYMSGTSQAASIVSGSLALLTEAFPGKTGEEYKTMLHEMSTVPVERRNSNDPNNTTSDDLTGTWFDFQRPALNFENAFDWIKNYSVSEIIVNSNIPQGPDSNDLVYYGSINTERKAGIDAIAEEGEERSIRVYGDVKGADAGIVVYAENKGDLDIFVPGTVQGGTVGILVKGTPGVDPQNIRITVGAVKPNDAGHLIEYEDGSPAEDLGKDINFIIDLDQPEKGKIEVVNGELIHGFNTAKKGQRVYIRASAGVTVYDPKTNEELPRTASGLYYFEMDVPNGEPIRVSGVSKPQNTVQLFRFPGNLLGSELPGTGFSTLGTQDPLSRTLKVDYRPANLTLKLPKLSVESEILIVPEAGGEYPVEWLGGSVSMLEGSGRPGEGIVVLTGHNHLNAEEAGPFVALGALETGDRIFLSDRFGRLYLYEVAGNYKIPADGFASIAEDLKENTLVLITCEDESMYVGYLNRRVIFAEPI